jgi:hypothetical protein
MFDAVFCFCSCIICKNANIALFIGFRKTDFPLKNGFEITLISQHEKDLKFQHLESLQRHFEKKIVEFKIKCKKKWKRKPNYLKKIFKKSLTAGILYINNALK